MGAYEFCWNRSHFFGNLAQLGPVCCGFLGIPPAPFCPKVSQGFPSPKSALIVFLRENPQPTGSSGLRTGIRLPSLRTPSAATSSRKSHCRPRCRLCTTQLFITAALCGPFQSAAGHLMLAVTCLPTAVLCSCSQCGPGRRPPPGCAGCWALWGPM